MFSSAPWMLPAAVKRQRRLACCSINEARQHWRHGHQLFWVAFGVRSDSWDDADRSLLRYSTLTAHCSSLARYLGAVWLWQWNSRMARRNFMHSGTRSAGCAEVVRCGLFYDCYSPVLLPRWALTADDPSDSLWCHWVWRCRSRDETEPPLWQATAELAWRWSNVCIANSCTAVHTASCVYSIDFFTRVHYSHQCQMALMV